MQGAAVSEGGRWGGLTKQDGKPSCFPRMECTALAWNPKDRAWQRLGKVHGTAVQLREMEPLVKGGSAVANPQGWKGAMATHS